MTQILFYTLCREYAKIVVRYSKDVEVLLTKLTTIPENEGCTTYFIELIKRMPGNTSEVIEYLGIDYISML